MACRHWPATRFGIEWLSPIRHAGQENKAPGLFRCNKSLVLLLPITAVCPTTLPPSSRQAPPRQRQRSAFFPTCNHVPDLRSVTG